MNSVRAWFVVIGLAGLLATAALWGLGIFAPAPPDAVDWFEDKSLESGINFTYKNGEEAELFTMLETLGGGVALLDYDQDGLLDIFLTGGGCFGPKQQILGHPNRLFRNEGNWRFRDVTALVGLPVSGLFYSHGAFAADYDNDGRPDLLVTGYGRMALFRNEHGKFTEVTQAAGLLDQRSVHWSTSAAWADLNGDGLLDLFVGHYLDWSFANHPRCASDYDPKQRDVCSPMKFERLMPALFLNQGNGTFKDVGASAGLVPGKALGVVVVDVNEDGLPDVYVANDGSGNTLYRNQGGGRFEEVAAQIGLAFNMQGNPDGSMGIAVGDYNHTGRPSFFVTNYQNQVHSLYRNLGNDFFEHAEHVAGLSQALGRDHVGWGTGFFDFDLDGSEDLFITHGHPSLVTSPSSPLRQRPALFRNAHRPNDKRALARLEPITDRGGSYFRAVHRGRGAAFGDLDNDGAADLVVSHANEPVVLLRNTVANRGNWLGIDLTGAPQRDAFGAKLTLHVAGKRLTRWILGGGSYLSTSDRRVVFGLGQSTAVEELHVTWPDGRTQNWPGKDLKPGEYQRLVQAAPNAK